ncbi:MAG: hypothetical protein ONB11_06945 [candidate division KSB1 bacterium]|nr:hypothetical protein [candidate division KSB1 bacterium]
MKENEEILVLKEEIRKTLLIIEEVYLDKMALRIQGVREPAISENTYKNLLEIMRFRHFKRDYFELDYDWDKLDFISQKFEKAYLSLKKDLQAFTSFLDLLNEAGKSQPG